MLRNYKLDGLKLIFMLENITGNDKIIICLELFFLANIFNFKPTYFNIAIRQKGNV